ncbi:MAG: hypothetical protein WD872_16565 [Pirellulaceae bacterium]
MNAIPSTVALATARDLRCMTQHQRDAALRAAAALAETQYRTNEQLTAFEAFGREAFPGDISSALAR